MKKNLRFTGCIIALLLCAGILLSGCGEPQTEPPQEDKSPEPELSLTVSRENAPKYVFFFIGDGMGFAHQLLAAHYLQDTQQKALMSGTFPVQSSISTDCLDGVTDSAAAGTALATGHKTGRGVIGMLPGGAKLENILEAANKKLKMSTGIITTTSLTHATPASFYAHVSSRSKESDIAEQLSASGVDFLAGGGLRYFLPSGYTAQDKDAFGSAIQSARKDDLNLLNEFRKSGYTLFTGVEGAGAFLKYAPQKGDKVLAAFTTSHTPYQADRAGNPAQNTPDLSVCVQKAIELLSQNENGFYLMVEAGHIDIAAHLNDGAGVLYETLALEKAVETAYRFYRQHPDETLIVVTADHETGDLSMGYPNASALKGVTISADKLQSAYNGNPEAYYTLLFERFGLKNMSEAEKAKMEKAFKTAKKDSSGKAPAAAASKILNARAKITFGSFSHTAKKVPLSAIGCKSDALAAVSDNAELGRAMFRLLGLTS